jgi:hypothetical protein
MREALKMLFEQTLKDIDSGCLVRPFSERGELKRQLISHIDIEQSAGCG